MNESVRPGFAGERTSLFWPGMAVTLLLWTLSTLAGAGDRLGSPSSFLAVGLTCLGMTLAGLAEKRGDLG